MAKAKTLERKVGKVLVALTDDTHDFGGNFALEIYEGEEGGACDSGLPAGAPKGVVREYLAAVIDHVRALKKGKQINWRNGVHRMAEAAQKAVFGGNGRRFFKTIIVLEVLSEDRQATDMELKDLAYEVTDGGFSARTVSETVTLLSARQAARALEGQGSDPGFFGLDEDDESGDDLNERLAMAA